MKFALDSWAVLRLLDGDEPAASRVQDVLDHERSVMSWMNLGEVYYIVRRAESDAEAREAIRDLRGLLTLDVPSEARVLSAAAIKADHAMAYADAFAAATALATSTTLLTGDPELLLPASTWRWQDLRSPPEV